MHPDNPPLPSPTRDSPTHLAAIVESSHDAIVTKTLGGIITSWNAGAERIFGYDAEEVVGGSIDVIIPPNRITEEREFLARIARGERIEHFETVRLRKDGRLIDVSITISPLCDRAGRVVGASKIARDITERKLAEEQVRRLNTELERRVRDRTAALEAANRELEAFAYSVSHDLRTPLRSIDGFSRIVLEDYADKLDDDGRDSLNRIRAAAQRMATLIDDLLGLSRVTRDEMHRVPVDLSALVGAIAAELRQRQPERRATVTVAPGLRADGDPRLLQAALDNLLGNAWKFTGKVAEARIEFGEERSAGEISYFVRDNGAGFDPAFAGKMFGAFQRMHNSAEFPGTGIGLATVQRIIRRHGGRVWAEGQVDRGATFHFTLGPAIAPTKHAYE